MISPWIGGVVIGPRPALPRLPVCWLETASALDRDAHRAGGAGDDLRGLLDVVGVEVLELRLGDLTDLCGCEATDLGLVWLTGALGHAGGLLDELRGRRGLRDERERPVLVDRDLHGDHVAALRLRLRVVRLAELHDVDAVLAQRGADRRGRRGLAGLDLQLDDS